MGSENSRLAFFGKDPSGFGPPEVTYGGGEDHVKELMDALIQIGLIQRK